MNVTVVLDELSDIRPKQLFVIQTKAVFTLQVLMHKSHLLTIYDFLSRLFTFIIDTTGIRYLCLHEFPPKRIVCSDRFMHMVDPRVLNCCAIKIINVK